MDNMVSVISLIDRLLSAFTTSRNSQERDKQFYEMMKEMKKETATNAQDREVIQNLIHIIETSIGRHQNDLLSAVQEREAYKAQGEAYKAQVDELTRKVDELMKKDKESPTQDDPAMTVKMELLRMLEKYKQEKRRQRYEEAINYAQEPQLPWADDMKKPYKMNPHQHNGGAYGKFDRQSRPGYDHGVRRTGRGGQFEIIEHDDCMPQFQRPLPRQRPFNYNCPPQSENFHKFPVPGSVKEQNFSRSESRDDRYQETVNRGSGHLGPFHRGGRGGSHFCRGGVHHFGASSAGYENKQFQPVHNPSNSGPHDQKFGRGSLHHRGHFQNRGQGRGQFRGRGNSQNKVPFQQNPGQTSNKEDDKKSEEKVNLTGLSAKEVEVYTQLFLQYQLQQQTINKGQENRDEAGKTAFKKKRKPRNKKKTDPNMKVKEESSDDDNISDSAEEASAATCSNTGVKKKTSKNVDTAGKSDSSTAFEMFKGSDFDMSLAVGVDPKTELKDVMLIARLDDEFFPFIPTTVKELLDFKQEHPNAKTLLMKKQ